MPKIMSKDKLERIGQEAYITTKKEKLEVRVRILDYKFSYGNHRWLITPVNGSGEAWVENVVFNNKSK